MRLLTILLRTGCVLAKINLSRCDAASRCAIVRGSLRLAWLALVETEAVAEGQGQHVEDVLPAAELDQLIVLHSAKLTRHDPSQANFID